MRPRSRSTLAEVRRTKPCRFSQRRCGRLAKPAGIYYRPLHRYLQERDQPACCQSVGFLHARVSDLRRDENRCFAPIVRHECVFCGHEPDRKVTRMRPDGEIFGSRLRPAKATRRAPESNLSETRLRQRGNANVCEWDRVQGSADVVLVDRFVRDKKFHRAIVSHATRKATRNPRCVVDSACVW